MMKVIKAAHTCPGDWKASVPRSRGYVQQEQWGLMVKLEQKQDQF